MEQQNKLIDRSTDTNIFCTLPTLSLLKYLEGQYSDFSLYLIPGFFICIAKCPIELPMGQHAHSDYEFLIPTNNALPATCERKILTAEKHKIMPFNSGQYHGPGDAPTTFNGFISISCEEDYMKKVCCSVFRRPDIMFKNESFSFTNSMRLFLNLFIEESVGKQAGASFLKENLACMLMTYIVREAKLEGIPELLDEKYDESRKIREAADFLREQFNSDFSLAEVSAISGFSPFYFIKLFKKQMKKTPYDFLLDIKIEKAKELLSKKSMNITEICFSCGFNNPSHFAYVFKRKTGVSPSEYRKMLL